MTTGRGGQVQAVLLLGDFARVTEGKLDVLGAGWTETGPAPATMGLGVLISVPWDMTNRRHQLRVFLAAADGQLVSVTNPDGSVEPIQIENEFEVGRPPGLAPGTPISFALAMNVNGLPLPPGERFEWRLELNGAGDETWNAAFQTRSAQPGPGAAAGSATGW